MDLLFSSLVGLVLLFSGAMKALDSRRFARHIERYGLLPAGHVPRYAVAFIGVECAFGASLLLQISPWLYPAGVLLFAGFLALSLWGASAKGLEDCGCYGNQVDLSPRQSAALDAVYIALLIAAWWTAAATPPAGLAYRIGAVAIVGAVAAALASRSSTNPLVDLLRIRPAARWNSKWLEQPDTRLAHGTHFVVFMSAHCPACKNWIPLLNVLDSRPDLPSITGVVSMPPEDVSAFGRQQSIRFPLVRMRSSLFGQMADAYPTAAMIVDGVVQKKWVGNFPPELAAKLDAFYRLVTPPAAPVKRVSAARAGRFAG